MAKKKIQINTDQRPFIMVYKDFLESNLLDNYYQRLVYIYLKKFANSKNQCYPSIKTISKQSGISVNKIRITLNELEEKGIIVKENRSRLDGGKNSNLYTLYDYKELWNAGSNEEAAKEIDKIEERHMIETLTAKGYYISKEKGLVSDKALTADTSTTTNKQNTNNKSKSQVERYTMENIKALYEYDSLIIQYPAKQTDIDIVFEILHETLNNTKQTIKIGGGDKPQMVVIGKLMKLEPDDLIYSIKKYHEQTKRIKNVKGYLLTILFNSHEQNHLDLMNLGHHNGDF